MTTQVTGSGSSGTVTLTVPDTRHPNTPAAPAGVREEGKPSQRTAWMVFARRKYDEPLYLVGTVTADDPDMAVVYARSIYDEHPWIEMLVLPRAAAHTVIAP